MNHSARQTAGVVLVGGQSRRMGQDKALLNYNGQPLYRHMKEILLAAGLEDIYYSGTTIAEQSCIEDPVAHQGPARAIAHLMQHFHGQYDRLLIVPVDMPLLDPRLLARLLQNTSSCILGKHPFPLLARIQPVLSQPVTMHQLIMTLKAQSIEYPTSNESSFSNINTPEEWAALN